MKINTILTTIMMIFVLLSCTNEEVQSPIQKLNPKPSFDIIQNYTDLWKLSLGNEECYFGHVVCDDGTYNWINFEEEGGCFCPLPTTNCLCEIVIIGGVINVHQDFIEAVINSTCNEYFDDNIWDDVFSNHPQWLSGLRNGTIIIRRKYDNYSEKAFYIAFNSSDSTFYYEDLIFALPFDESINEVI